MTYYMKSRFGEMVAFFVLMICTSLVYILFKWPITPQGVIDNMAEIGTIGVVFDVIFILIVGRWIAMGKRMENSE